MESWRSKKMKTTTAHSAWRISDAAQQLMKSEDGVDLLMKRNILKLLILSGRYSDQEEK